MSHKVFISYSHDSEEHQQKVLALADRLREGNPSRGLRKIKERG